LKRREWRKRQKKKPKMKVGHFEKKFSKGIRLEFFFANRIKKKNSHNHHIYILNKIYELVRLVDAFNDHYAPIKLKNLQKQKD